MGKMQRSRNFRTKSKNTARRKEWTSFNATRSVSMKIQRMQRSLSLNANKSVMKLTYRRAKRKEKNYASATWLATERIRKMLRSFTSSVNLTRMLADHNRAWKSANMRECLPSCATRSVLEKTQRRLSLPCLNANWLRSTRMVDRWWSFFFEDSQPIFI